MPTALTPRQQQLLNYLEKVITAEGKAPSLRQTAADLGVSHTAVAQCLTALEGKGYLKRDGRYSRSIYLLNRLRQPAGPQRVREVPIIGRVTAGLPLYAQQTWDGSVVLDTLIFRGQNLFALRIRGDSMRDARIHDGDLAICEPRQYAMDREIVVALINGEEATVKRFFRHPDHIELRPENPRYTPMRYPFSEVLIQGKVIGIHRGPEVMERI
ncbi:MAG: transcriptional repressor LexA [Pseudomonadota bacterium]